MLKFELTLLCFLHLLACHLRYKGLPAQVSRRLPDGETSVFAFRGTFTPEDWGINSQTSMAVLGTAGAVFPWKAFPSDARVHSGFLKQFLETVGSPSAAEPTEFRKKVCRISASFPRNYHGSSPEAAQHTWIYASCLRWPLLAVGFSLVF